MSNFQIILHYFHIIHISFQFHIMLNMKLLTVYGDICKQPYAYEPYDRV